MVSRPSFTVAHLIEADWGQCSVQIDKPELANEVNHLYNLAVGTDLSAAINAWA